MPWRGTWEGEQGGAVLGHAIHSHDLLCWFFGPVKRVSTMTTTRVHDIETENCAAISFAMKNGALATSSITLGAANDSTRLRFCFEHLSAESGPNSYTPAKDKGVFTARDLDGSESIERKQDRIDDCIANVTYSHAGYVGFLMLWLMHLQARVGMK